MKHGRVRSIAYDAGTIKRPLDGMFPISHFFELMDCVDDFVLLLDEELLIQKANRNSSVYTGYSEEELRAKRFLLILEGQERKRVSRIISSAKARRGGETVLRTKARAMLRIEFSVSPLRDDGGALVGYLLVGRPMASSDPVASGTLELRKRILEGVAEPLFVVDTASRVIIDCNQCALDLSGYRASELLGRTIFDFVSFGGEGESVGSRMERVNEAYARFGLFQRRVLFSRKTGAAIPCECYGMPFLRDGGRVDLTIVALIDRSEEDRRRILLEEFADRAGKFAADLALFAGGSGVRVRGKRLSALGFTPRQVEVAKLVSDGCPSKEIGHRLGIAESTVKNHLASMFKKMGATSRVDFLHKLAEGRIWIA